MPQPQILFTSFRYKMLYFILSILGMFFVFPPSFSFAETLQISEIDPFSEFIEIENISDEEINIEHWKWSEMSGSTEKIYKFNTKIIPPHNFFILEISRKINNSGDVISLYNENNEKIERIIIPNAKNFPGKTYQKINNNWGWATETKNKRNISENTNDNNAENPENADANSEEKKSEEINNEKEKENIIIISEVLPNPEGVDGDNNEFFELFNSEEEEVNISSWYITDASGKKFIFPEHTKIEAKTYKSFYRKDSKIILNNSNESLTLFSSSDEKISEISFSENVKSGESYSYFSDGYKWTENISPNKKNIIPYTKPQEEKIAGTRENFSLFPPLSDKTDYSFHKDIEMEIIKVSPRGKPDFIEIKCIKCSGNIYGIRLGIDGIAYTIPKNISAHSGDILRFEFQKTEKPKKITQKKISSGGKIYVFTVNSNGFVFSDETITIGTADGRILDAMCYANMNGNLISQEKKEIGQLILQHEWKGEVKEWSCLDSSAFPKNSIFKRIGRKDSNSKKDFIRIRNEGEGGGGEEKEKNNERINQYKIENEKITKEKKKKENIWFSYIAFDEKNIQLRIINNGEKFINIKNWYLTNKEKWMRDIANDDIILYPHQEIFIQLPSIQKKYQKENMTLEIRNEKGEIFDVLCINIAKDIKNNKKSMQIISHWNQKKLWEKERKKKRCFEYHQINKKEIYERTLFKHPSSLGQYSKNSKKEEKKMKRENIKKKNNGKKKLKENDNDFFLETKITPQGLYFSGKIPKGKKGEKKITKIKISIPSRNISIITPIKKYKFSGTIGKSIKKGRYALDIFFIRSKKEEFFTRKRILLSEQVLPNEIQYLQFAKVLPNPKGKDKKNEKIIIANMQNSAGWMRGWSISIETKNKIQTKNLPYFFIEPKEQISIPSLYIPSLKNTQAHLKIYNASHKIISELSWTKARTNEYFGIYAPKYSSPHKKITKNKKKKRKNIKGKKDRDKGKLERKKFIYKNKEQRKGIIISFQKNKIFIFTKYFEKNRAEISQHNNSYILKNKIIEYTIPEYITYSKDFFKEGRIVSLLYKKGELKEVTPILISSDFSKGGGLENTKDTNNFLYQYLLEIFIFLGVFGFGGLTSLGIRKLRQYK